MKRSLTLATAAGLLTLALAACNPTTTSSSNDGASSNPSVGITTHSVVVSGSGAIPTSAATAASSDTSPIPEQLRDLDIAAGVNPQPQSAYDAAWGTLSGKCQEQGVKLGNEVGAVLKLLQQHNINDETQLSVMQHLSDSIPAGSPKMGCADIGAAYVTLREGGQ